MRYKWIIIIFILLLGFGTPMVIRAMVNQSEQDKSLEYEANLSAACESAISIANKDGKIAFSSDEVRKRCIEQFYRTLNNTVKENAIDYVPVLILADNDGYYVAFRKVNREDKTVQYEPIITNKSTYAKSYIPGVILSYQLDGIVKYITYAGDEGFLYTREDRKEFYDTHPFKQLAFLKDDELFNQEKQSVIAGVLTEQAAYYINTQNNFINLHNMSYNVQIPALSNDTLQEITMPSMIAFLQGEQLYTYVGYANPYAFTSSEETEESFYEVSNVEDTTYYHIEDCSHKGKVLFTGDKSSCTGYGAYPCPFCILQ